MDAFQTYSTRMWMIYIELYSFLSLFFCYVPSFRLISIQSVGYTRQKKKILRTFFEITMCSPCIKSTKYPLTWKSFASKYFSLDGISNDYQIEIVPRFVDGSFFPLHFNLVNFSYSLLVRARLSFHSFLWHQKKKKKK